MFETTILDIEFDRTEVGTFDVAFDVAQPWIGQTIEAIGAIVVEVVQRDDIAKTTTVAVCWAD